MATKAISKKRPAAGTNGKAAKEAPLDSEEVSRAFSEIFGPLLEKLSMANECVVTLVGAARCQLDHIGKITKLTPKDGITERARRTMAESLKDVVLMIRLAELAKEELAHLDSVIGHFSEVFLGDLERVRWTLEKMGDDRYQPPEELAEVECQCSFCQEDRLRRSTFHKRIKEAYIGGMDQHKGKAVPA